MKKLTTAILAGALSLSLAACGNGEEKSAKDLIVDSSKNLQEVNSVEFDGSLTASVEGDEENPQAAQMAQALENSKIDMDVVYDKEAGKTEVTLGADIQMSPMNFQFSMPILVDENEKMMYIDGDSLVDSFGMFAPGMTAAKGKLITMDLEETGVSTEETEEMTMEEFLDESELELTKEEPSEEEKEAYNQAKHKVSFVAKSEDIRKMIDMASEKSMVSETDMEQVEQSLSMFKEMEMMLFINKDSQLVGLQANMMMEDPTTGQMMTFNLDGAMDKFNEDVTFSIDPSSKETISLEELGMAPTQMP